MTKIILLINPRIKNNEESPNRGDGIISRASKVQLRTLFPDYHIEEISSHNYPKLSDINKFISAEYIFVGGSNLLWFRIFPPASWKLGIIYLLFARKINLLGVGWGSYEIKPNWWGKIICKLILNKKSFHSVRDDYTHKMLNKLGVYNVLNTGCHTTWNLKNSVSNQSEINQRKKVIFTLTDYRKDPHYDKMIYKKIKNTGKDLVFWIQGKNDLEYAKSLCLDVEFLDLDSVQFINYLEKNKSNLLYVGTRLHCGIACLEFNIPSIIISVDNRAREMGKDLSLPVINREEFSDSFELNNLWSNNNFIIKEKEIQEWKKSIKF